MKKNLLIVALIFGLVKCYAQSSIYPYAPGAMIPSLITPLSSGYDYTQGTLGRVELINNGGACGLDRSTFSIVAGESAQVSRELFRVCANGTTALFGRWGGYPSLNFYTSNRYYLGNIDFSNEEFSIRGLRGVDVYARESKVFRFDIDTIFSYENFKVKKHGVNMHFGLSHSRGYGWVGSFSNHGVMFGTDAKSALYIGKDQSVTIGFNSVESESINSSLKNKYLLFVKRGVLAEDFAVGPANTWADYVFNEDYKLRELDKLEEYINEHKHLPDIPSAEEVAENGYSQHEINMQLLKKIEELTLYIIEQNKQIEQLKQMVEVR